MAKHDIFEIDYDNNNNRKFDDLYSNSEKYQIDTEKIDDYFGNSEHSYRRKKRGIFKFFDNIKFKMYKWWKCMKKSKKAFVVSSIAIVLALTVFVALGGLNYLFYNYKKVTGDLGAVGRIDENITNIALFGIDSRDTKGKTSFVGNTDSIMILSINTKTNKIKIISLLRDTFVPIYNGQKKIGYGKINSAYAKGAASTDKDKEEAAARYGISTINKNFNLDIEEYATVNFYGMAEIIDAVGGIDVELTKNEVTARGNNNHGINDMIQEICYEKGENPNKYYVTKWGKQHLNGLQAVAYSRIRYCTNIWGTSNDYGRTDRQRFVMKQLFNSVKDLKKSKYVSLVKALVPCTQTSLELDKIISIGWSVMQRHPTFEEYRIPLTYADADKEKGEKGTDYDFLITPTPSGYGSVIYMDLDYASKVIHAIIYSDMTAKDYIKDHPVEKNKWYNGGYSGSSGGSSLGGTSDKKNSSSSSTVPKQNDNKTEKPKEIPEDDPKTNTSEIESGGDVQGGESGGSTGTGSGGEGTGSEGTGDVGGTGVSGGTGGSGGTEQGAEQGGEQP